MSKELLAFALVAEEYEKTGDPLRGLKPLFAPLLLGNKLKPFDAEKFAADFTAAYGLQMTSFVASALSERMEDLGLLVRSYDKNAGATYSVSDFEWAAEPIAEAQIERTIGRFVEWATQRSSDFKKNFDREVLETAILTRLGRPEFASIFALKGADTNSRLRRMMGVGAVDLKAKDEEFLDYLVAAFVLHVETHAPTEFDSISLIAYGSLIADAVAGLAVASRPNDGTKSLRIVLDAPLILDLLDLNSASHRQYAQGLVDIAKGASLELAIFDHSLEEIKQTIQTTLEFTARGEGYGPMAHRLRTESGMRLKATLIRDHVRARVDELGISVLRAELYREARYSKWFPEEKVDQVRNAIGDLHENLEARIKDAESVAGVARLKGDRGDAGSLFEAGTIFVTRNSVLCKRVNRFLSKGRSGPRPTFTIATDGQIAGVLWFVGGMQGAELSRRRLIATCSAAVLPKRELIIRISSLLEGIEPELRQEFEALMADSRASLCVMRLTAGDLDLIDGDKSLEVVSEMRKVIAEDAAEKVEAAEARAGEVEKRLGEEIDHANRLIVSGQESAARAASDAAAQIQSSNLELAQLRHEIDQARHEKIAADEEARRQREDIGKKIEELERDVDGRIIKFARTTRMVVMVAAAVVLVAAALPASKLWIRILAAVFSAVSLGLFTNFLAAALQDLAKWFFRKDLAAIEKLKRG